MILAVALAWALPGLGSKQGPLHPDIVNKLGVALIFFFNGTALSFASLKEGALRWPLHLLIQSATFVFFPLVGLGLLALSGGFISPPLALGFFFLCALPSTVSSSVALTSAAGGNVPVAIFNATLSSLLGVVLTPLWMSWHLQSQGAHSLALGKAILDLCLWLILPLVLGQLARPWLADWSKRNKKRIHLLDRGTILFIIYTSFCDSIAQGTWSGHGLSTLGIALGGGLLLFCLVSLSLALACRVFKFPLQDRVAAIFCGSKKTIASGVPMARLLFGSDPRLGLILLPLLIYHPMQLVICGVLANRWARRTT